MSTIFQLISETEMLKNKDFPAFKQSDVAFIPLICVIIGPRREITCLRGFANNTGADQPAHLRSLIRAFVFRYLKSTICKFVTRESSIH